MKKACKYCGGVHDRNYVCDRKPHIVGKKYYSKQSSKEDIFRSSYDWKKKREYIMKRDKYLCQACRNNFIGTVMRLTSDGLSVHHIIPLKNNYELRLSDKNLITLCSIHHKLAEKGEIPAEALVNIIAPLPFKYKKNVV
ncbi:MAG: HNH endonuclease [Ruminococcus sp.]|nr:HNH endonuclease [Ruminococcus sp.]